MPDFRVNADDFLKASKALKAAGQTGMRKDLNRRITAGAKPLIPKTRAAARSKLPTRGGLADKIAKAPQRVQVRTGKETAGVRIVVGSKGGGARGADRGVIKHPVFDTGRWVEQRVEPGWFSETLQREAPRIRPDVEQAIKDTLNRIARGV